MNFLKRLLIIILPLNKKSIEMLDRVWVKDDGKEIKNKKSENKKAPLLVEFIRTRMTL